jgi:cytoskeletal protein CcmA (bactofilin family)
MFSKGVIGDIQDEDDANLHIEYSPKHSPGQESGSLIVGQGVILNGSLQVPERTLVSGALNGELHTKNLIVMATGQISGKIRCENADISGAIGEDLTTSEMLILRSTSVITGSIHYKEIQIDRGAKITGKLILL